MAVRCLMAYGAKTGGRKKGTRNKVTQGAVSNIMQVFEMLGGNEGFAEWALENRTEFYRHYSKLIPVQLTGDAENPIVQRIERVITDGNTQD